MAILIRSGRVYDGSGRPPFSGDVLIEGERIAAIGPQTGSQLAAPASGVALIDARGRVVCPGFVDTHRHADAAVFSAPEFGETELAQGITTTVVGNCGIAPVPAAANPRWREDWYRYIEPVIGTVHEGLPFESYTAYAAALEKLPLPINLGFLAGAGAVKTAVRGFARTAFSPEELAQAAAHIGEAMDAGALGLSFGIMYQPECYSRREELIALARPAAKAGGILCTHIRGEGDSLPDSVQEMIDVAESAGIPLNISHFKATGIRNWRSAIFQAIARIEAARARGQAVTADFYPYDGGSTTLLSLIPPDIREETPAALAGKLAGSTGREALRRSISGEHPGWDNMAASIGWDRVLLSSGQSIKTAAAGAGYADPVDLLCDLLVNEGYRTGIILLSMAQEDIDTVANLPWTALISDALYGGGENPHPRLHGAFPKFLRDYVQERPLMPLERAIQKMTSIPAERFGIAGRGRLEPGAFADVLVFDPASFTGPAGYAHPRERAAGMDTVLVNGNIAWEDGAICARAGKPVWG
ncbi:MAG: amidohydrolase family protein [Treponema sp.]|jgi:N-acyl-D-aspartate/D-glutamate deacylase|nr:amidohydrolase family protein [Treponema sp.]